MILYNLFIFFSVREKGYLFYILYISIFVLFQAGIQGYTFEYFWPENTWWANISIPFFGVLSLFFALQFARSVLNTKNTIPYFDRILLITSACMFFTLPIILFGEYDFGILLALIVTFIYFNLVLLTALLGVMKGDRTSKLFAWAWSIFLVSGSISLIGITGFLPLENANMIAMQMGSAVEVVLLSIVLADRINSVKAEKIELEAESRKILINANKQL
jgi:hypothetical protein